MKPLKCIIIDDEPLAREVIETFVKQIPFLELTESFGDALEALFYLQNNDTDILFSDIQMPNINGVELVKSISKLPSIIFVTAHRDFAVDGFETGAIDYLLKPVRFDRFLKAVLKAKDQIQQKNKVLLNQVKTDRLFIKSDGRIIKILLDEIHYVEAQGDYIKIFISKQDFTTQVTLKSMEELLLPPKFFRAQRSFIINLDLVRSVDGNNVELTSGKKITISSAKKEELYNLLGID